MGSGLWTWRRCTLLLEIDAAIGQALSLEEAAALSPAERVAAYLEDRHLLLVLDDRFVLSAGHGSILLVGFTADHVVERARRPVGSPSAEASRRAASGDTHVRGNNRRPL